MIRWYIPVRLISPNTKEHWSKPYKRKKDISWMLHNLYHTTTPKPEIPAIVYLERQIKKGGRQRFFDSDNLIFAFKQIRDIIADILRPGLAPGRADDDEDLIKWQYSQAYADHAGIQITINTGTYG